MVFNFFQYPIGRFNVSTREVFRKFLQRKVYLKGLKHSSEVFYLLSKGLINLDNLPKMLKHVFYKNQ